MIVKIINSIGQRRASILLVAASVVLSLTAFTVKEGIQSWLTFKPWFAIALMSAPIAFLSKAAHKSTDKRLLSIALQATLLVVNIVLLYGAGPDFFALFLLAQILASIIFLIFFVKKPVKKSRSRHSASKRASGDASSSKRNS